MVNGFMLRRNARGFAFAGLAEDRGAGHPAVIAACRAQARPLAQRGLVASLLCGAALLMGSDGALAAACTFPLSLAQGATCDGLTVNNGQNGTVDNSGAIVGTNGAAVLNNGTITNFTNELSGTIQHPGTQGNGITNYGTISTFTNYGSISSNTTIDGSDAFINFYGTITDFINRGSIAGFNHGVRNYGIMKKIDNYGTITSLWDTAAGNDAILGSFINEASGKLIGYQNGYWNNRQITDFYNYGLIEGQTNVGFVNDRNVSIVNDSNPLGQTVLTNLKNYGTIKGALDGIDNYYQIENIYNDSVATISGGDIGLYSWGSFPTIARIANIINDGSISGASRYGIYNDGPNVSITSITNKGSITGGLFGIYNDHGSIGTLTNGQGGNGASAETKALTYKGNLPSSYFIYVSSATHYGQTAFTSPAGSMTFGVAGGSNLANGTYKSVITGLTSLFVSATSVKSINGATWSFHLNGVSDNVWDLDVTGVVDNLVPVAPPRSPLPPPTTPAPPSPPMRPHCAIRSTLAPRSSRARWIMTARLSTLTASACPSRPAIRPRTASTMARAC